GAHCVLTSFPTRRSSDLRACERKFVGPFVEIAFSVQVALCVEISRPVPIMPKARSRRRRLVRRGRVPFGVLVRCCPCRSFRVPRSEEHTSELQSLRHLVC